MAASVIPAAISNAAFDATGVRLRSIPKWIIEEALDEEGNVIWVEVTDPKTGEIKKDGKGNVLYRHIR